jgi:hypothetical protein
MDPENLCDFKDFAEHTLEKNGTEANFTLDTLSAPKVKNIFSPENMAVFIPHLRETVNCPKIKHPKTSHANFFPEKHLISGSPFFYFYNNKEKFQNFRFFKNNFYKNFKNKITNYCDRIYQLLSLTGNFPLCQNLGGRGHRFLMTVESRISRFKIVFNKNSFCAGGPLLNI